MYTQFYIGITADTAALILHETKKADTPLAITVSKSEESLESLYNVLVSKNKQKFLFVLPQESLGVDILKKLLRYFFLKDYIFKNNAPIILYKGTVDLSTKSILNDLCEKHGFDVPSYNSIELYDGKSFPDERFVNVPSDVCNYFLSGLYNKLVTLECLSQKILLEINSFMELQSVSDSLKNTFAKLKKNNPGIYKAIEKLSVAEDQLQKNDVIIKFQKIEIDNQKLYNSLNHRGEVRPVSQSQHPVEMNKLVADYNSACFEIGRLKNQLAWYKRTYENRSLIGTIKEKIIQKNRK